MNGKEVFVKVVELEQETIRLKEQNREMTEVLTKVCDEYMNNTKYHFDDSICHRISFETYDQAYRILYKLSAESEGEVGE